MYSTADVATAACRRDPTDAVTAFAQLHHAAEHVERALLGIALAKQSFAGLGVANLRLLGQCRQVVLLKAVNRRECLELSAVDLLRHQRLVARPKYADK